MDFWKIVLGLLRRRYIGPPVIAGSVLIGVLTFIVLPTHYQSTAFMVLTTPSAGGTKEPDRPLGQSNPLLLFNDGLRTTASILIQSQNTRDALEQLGQQKDGPTTVIINDGSTNPDVLGTNGPFIYVEGDSTSFEDARGIVVRAQQRIRDELVARQKALGAPESTFISVVDVTSASEPEALLAAKVKAAAVGFVLSFLFGLAGAYWFQRRPRKWPTEDEDHGQAAAGPAPPVDPPTVKMAPVVRNNGNGSLKKAEPQL